MQTGKLDTKINLQKLYYNTNSLGEQVPAPIYDNHEVWAAIDYTGGKEQVNTTVAIASTDVKFTVRHSSITSQVTTKWRVYYKTDFYDITRIQHEGRNRFIHIYAVKREGKE